MRIAPDAPTRRCEMPSLFAIAVIGQRGQLLVPADTPWFRDMTWGKELVASGSMQKKTPRLITAAELFDSPDALRQYARDAQENIFLIGGASAFAKFAGVVDRWYIDKTSYDGPSDEWFNPMWLVAES